ncbi:MAG: hypothetical protein AAGA35_03145 [Patescibacteria group bacterium]
MQRFIVLEKEVGQTPLQCMEVWRSTKPELKDVPLAYAGRLDPMASGKLLVLIGDECKRQTEYHGLDKEYEFQVLFDVSSDSGDVLGIIRESQLSDELSDWVRHGLAARSAQSESLIAELAKQLTGKIHFPYPAYSSKPVNGKPLHTWAVEGRLSEIEIPTYTATIYALKLNQSETKVRQDIYKEVSEKIETIPPVTELRKAIGNDFRRPDIRKAWRKFSESGSLDDEFLIATFTCIGSSGLYMRTLAEEIANRLNTTGLAYSIHRTKIGKYQNLLFRKGFWWKTF